MRLSLLPNGDISLTRIHPLEADALQSIPKNADSAEVPEAEKRLYPSPIAPGSDSLESGKSEQDWVEYVEPELRELFEGAIQRVAKNLVEMKPDEEEEGEEDEEDGKDGESLMPFFALTIPRDLAEDLYRAMNQARLVMAEKTLWIEDNGRLHGPFVSQIHYEIYTGFQGWLVEMVLSNS